MATFELEARLDNLLATAQTETANIDLLAPMAEREECPICLIPLPFDESEIAFMTCCGKQICNGCSYKSMLTYRNNGVPTEEFKCAHCRRLISKSNPTKELKRLIKKNNAQAFIQMGIRYANGEGVFQSNTKALEMFIKSAELGNAPSYFKIGQAYKEGIGVEQDESKALDFYEVSAKKGYFFAHKFLADFHGRNGDIHTSMRHIKVTASAGDQESMAMMMKFYKDKLLSKEELTQILRAHQTSSNELRTNDRDEACAFYAERL